MRSAVPALNRTAPNPENTCQGPALSGWFNASVAPLATSNTAPLGSTRGLFASTDCRT